MSESTKMMASRRIKRKEVARIGPFSIIATTFRLVLAPSPTQEAITMKEQRLLVSGEQSEKYIDIDDASEKYRVAEDILEQLCEDGTINARNVDGRWQILEESLNSWLDTQE